jgi:hypothetical protein
MWLKFILVTPIIHMPPPAVHPRASPQPTRELNDVGQGSREEGGVLARIDGAHAAAMPRYPTWQIKELRPPDAGLGVPLKSVNSLHMEPEDFQ